MKSKKPTPSRAAAPAAKSPAKAAKSARAPEPPAAASAAAPSEVAAPAESAPTPPTALSAPARVAEAGGLAASAKAIAFGPGLYAVVIGEAEPMAGGGLAMDLPATHMLGVAREGRPAPRLFAQGSGSAGWVGPRGGAVVADIPGEGGQLLVTTYRPAGRDAVPLAIQVTRLDRQVVAPAGAARPAKADAPAAASPASDVELELLLHIERIGDVRFPGGEWAGQPGQKRRVEAISVRPLDKLLLEDIEYKAFGPSGRETPWAGGGKVVGTRGRGMPLTGVAVRLSPTARERFHVRYEGAFFDGGVVASADGEACKSARLDDPLEAVRVWIVEAKGR